MLHYLAYGSNLHPIRLAERVPSARLLQRLRLDDCRVVFHKRGQDGSAKCSLERSVPGEAAYAAVYGIDPEEKGLLDRFEGCGGGYCDITLVLHGNDQLREVFTYIAQPEYLDPSLRPFDWYRDLVVAGSEYLAFPSTYTQLMRNTQAIPDDDTLRAGIHQHLLERVTGALPAGTGALPPLQPVRL